MINRDAAMSLTYSQDSSLANEPQTFLGTSWDQAEQQVHHPTDLMLHTTGLVDGQPVTRLLMLFDDEESDDQLEYDDPE